jgi:hypothetical protein
VGRGRGVGVLRGMQLQVALGLAVGVTVEFGVDVGVIVGVCVAVAVAVAVVVGVAVGVGVGSPLPPQTIISLPVQTAVCPYRAAGAFVPLVGIQLFVPGLYLRPSFKYSPPVLILVPPQRIISLPVQIAVWYIRG